MEANYDHYISRNIKAFYRRRLFSPVLFLLLLLVLWLVFPLRNMLTPSSISQSQSFKALYESGDRYIKTTLTDLHFTGYTNKRFGSTSGYYYYTLWGGQCSIILLSPDTCEEGLPYISSITIRGKIMNGGAAYSSLLSALAEDLDWTEEGIDSQLTPYYLSEPDINPICTLILFLVYFGTMFYSILLLIRYIIYMQFPFLAPACQNLVVFGHPKQMLEEAEEELATLPQLATEDMFITEHYFIMTSPYGNAFVPIKEILWIYKHSTLHKFLWYHFSISYTMHVTANKHLYFHCPKNIKSDIDGIMDYLAEANHNIVVGFSEQNRLKVLEAQGKPFHIEKLKALLHRKNK